MSKQRRALLKAAAATTLLGALPAAHAQGRLFFGIATGGTGGTYYPLGGMLAQLISNKVVIGGQKMSATAETAGASVANAQLLGRKEIESAFVAADILDAAFNGKSQFDGKPLKGLRALGALYPEQVQLVTAAKSNIRGFRDLKGKSVSSGSPGSGIQSEASPRIDPPALLNPEHAHHPLRFVFEDVAVDHAQARQIEPDAQANGGTARHDDRVLPSQVRDDIRCVSLLLRFGPDFKSRSTVQGDYCS